MIRDIDSIMDLAEGQRSERQYMDIADIREETLEVLKEMEKLGQLAYALTYLEAKLVNDEFHESKNSFDDFGESYGYISSSVGQSAGSNQMRFFLNRPSNGTDKKFIKENISPTKNGYTLTAFKAASHDLERDLCISTEKMYQRLRLQGKQIKNALVKIKCSEIYKEARSKDKHE